eukprot:Anaeramoba_flamelloidesc38226_g1_i2.p1 GENE.c38226_g1_i2~~c38226_g1_i2.p1  ORF type:complete len:139 (+),score=35.39 c38226_g1_i2:309-725(+)
MAARRRFVKRIYVPLPTNSARNFLFKHLLKKQENKKTQISEKEISKLCDLTVGYSGADIHSICQEAALSPIREISDILSIDVNTVRNINYKDFEKALEKVKPSVSKNDLEKCREFNKRYGTYPETEEQEMDQVVNSEK